VDQTIEKTCGKQVGTSVSPVGGGTVVGTISPAQHYKVGSDFNGGFNCNPGDPSSDCGEFFHQNQSGSITAMPATNYRFLRWGSGTSPCPCDPNSAKCPLNYDAIGFYGPSSVDAPSASIDYSMCIAFFERIPSSPSPPPH
jgi:hypothetical protein